MAKEKLQEYGTESMERRAISYEQKEKEELEYLKEIGSKDWILLRQPKNQTQYSKLKRAVKKKHKKGAYMITGDVPLVLEVNSASTTMQRLMQLSKKGCELRHFEITKETSALAKDDQRISDLMAYLESQGERIKILKEAKASAKKIKAEFEKAKGAKNGSN